MADHEMGKALLTLDATAAGEALARRQAQRIQRWDRWRVGLLAVLTLLLWLAAAAGILFVIFIATANLYPKQRILIEQSALIPAERLIEYQGQQLAALEICTDIIMASIVALLLAALCTVWLVLSSRRATLRQVNAQLAEIAEQLRRLQSLPA